MKKRKLISLLLVGAMATATLISPIQAAEVPSPQEIAAARLQAEGLMAGDETGDLRLDQAPDPGGDGLPDQPNDPQPGACRLGAGLVHQNVHHQL